LFDIRSAVFFGLLFSQIGLLGLWVSVGKAPLILRLSCLGWGIIHFTIVTDLAIGESSAIINGVAAALVSGFFAGTLRLQSVGLRTSFGVGAFQAGRVSTFSIWDLMVLIFLAALLLAAMRWSSRSEGIGFRIPLGVAVGVGCIGGVFLISGVTDKEKAPDPFSESVVTGRDLLARASPICAVLLEISQQHESGPVVGVSVWTIRLGDRWLLGRSRWPEGLIELRFPASYA
jgi:hypothetical protein